VFEGGSQKTHMNNCSDRTVPIRQLATQGGNDRPKQALHKTKL